MQRSCKMQLLTLSASSIVPSIVFRFSVLIWVQMHLTTEGVVEIIDSSLTTLLILNGLAFSIAVVLSSMVPLLCIVNESALPGSRI